MIENIERFARGLEDLSLEELSRGAEKLASREAVARAKREIPDVRGRSRYIPSSVRERVLERAGYRCEYRAVNGVRCTARARLEVDHIRPLEKGGERGEANLRILWQGHNLLARSGSSGGVHAGEDRGTEGGAARRWCRGHRGGRRQHLSRGALL